MVDIVINPAETPSQAIIKSGNLTADIVDGQRNIVIKKLSAFDRMQLFKVVGPVNVENGPYLGYATFAWHVVSIDGEAIPRPGSVIALEALVKQLDTSGLEAIARAMPELYPEVENEAAAKDQVKNS